MDTYFYRSIRKYGFNNFTWEILKDDISTQEELDYYERYFIKKYHSFDDKSRGYNTTSGGQCGYTVTDEEKKNRSMRVKGSNNPMYGKEGTWKGKKFSDNHKSHLSEAVRNAKRKHPENTKRGSEHYCSKKIINLSTGEIFGSIIEASKKYNCNFNSISNNLRGKTKRSCGCKWSYIENVDLNNFKPLNDKTKNFLKKKVYVKELDKTFNTVKDASKNLNISSSYISQKCSILKNNEYAFIKNYHIKYI